MNTSPETQLLPSPNDFKSIVNMFREWILKHLRLVAIIMAVWGIVGWIVNVALMIFYYDGWSKVPSFGLATGSGNMIYGAFFWLLVGSVVASLIAHTRSKDNQKDRIKASSAEIKDEAQRKTIFFTGVALGVVLFQFLGTVVPLYAVILLVARMSIVAFWIMIMSFRAWLAAMGFLANRFPAQFSGSYNRAIEGQLNPLLWVARASGGLLVGASIDFLVDYLFLRFFMGEAFILPKLILFLVIGFCVWQVMKGGRKQGGSGDTLTSLILMLSALLADALLNVNAFADDGGWQESGGNFAGLRENPGFYTSIWLGAYGGLFAGIGAVGGFAAEKMFGTHLDIEAAMREEMARARARAATEKVIEADIEKLRNIEVKSGVIIPGHMQERLGELADAYYEATGKKLTVTDGVRTPEDQADRILKYVDNAGRNNVIALYSDKESIKKILDAADGEETRVGKLDAMTKVIEKLLAEGKYSSKNLHTNSVDIRVWDMDPEERETFKSLVDESPHIDLLDETKLKDGTPNTRNPHYHLSFRQAPPVSEVKQPPVDPERYSVHESASTPRTPDVKGK